MLGPDFTSILGEDYSEALDALRANIIDGQNKVTIVAATVVIGNSYTGPFSDPPGKICTTYARHVTENMKIILTQYGIPMQILQKYYIVLVPKFSI